MMEQAGPSTVMFKNGFKSSQGLMVSDIEHLATVSMKKKLVLPPRINNNEQTFKSTSNSEMTAHQKSKKSYSKMTILN
jgi:hypothetical protein